MTTTANEESQPHTTMKVFVAQDLPLTLITHCHVLLTLITHCHALTVITVQKKNSKCSRDSYFKQEYRTSIVILSLL